MNIQKLLYQNILWRGLFFLTSFFLNILISRHFEASITGWIYYIFNIFSFVTLIAAFSLESGMVYFGSNKKIAFSKLISFAIIWVCFIAAIMISGFFLFSNFSDSIQIVTFQYALMFVCGNILLTFLTGLFYAQHNYKAPNIAGIIVNVLLITILLLLKFKSIQIKDATFIFIFFGSYLLWSIILLTYMLYDLPKPFKFSLPGKTQLNLLFRYSTIAFITNFIFFLLYKIDYWFVDKYCTSDQLGNYIQVSKLAQMFFILPGILAGVVFPLISGNHIKRIANSLTILSRSIFFCYIIGCSILAIIGKWLFPFVFGETFSGMYIPFLLLIPGILALSTLYTLTAYFSGINRISVNLKGSILALIFIISGDAVFIPKYGINAAALTSSFGYIIYHVYVLAIFIKEPKTRVIDFFYFRFSDIQRMKQFIFKNINVG